MKTHSITTLALVQIVCFFALGHVRGEERISNYAQMIHSLFDRSSACQIKGEFVWKGVVHKVQFVADSKEKMEQLKSRFLAEKPEFIGLIDPENKPVSMYASYLDFKWLNDDKKAVGYSVIIDGDTLIFNDKHIYKTKDHTLLLTSAVLALPEVFDQKRVSK